MNSTFGTVMLDSLAEALVNPPPGEISGYGVIGHALHVTLSKRAANSTVWCSRKVLCDISTNHFSGDHQKVRH